MEDKDRIRKRESYKLLKEMYDLMSDPHKPLTEALKYMWYVIDKKKGWGSMTAAGYAWESFNQLIEDIENGQDNSEEHK